MKPDFLLILPSILIAFYQSQILWVRLPGIYPGDTEISGHYSDNDYHVFILVKRLLYVFFLLQALVYIYPISLNSTLMLYVKILGYILVLVGLVISVSAINSLSDNWTGMMNYRIKKGQKLITSGIYSHIRHPIYLAVIIEIIGYQLIVFSWFIVPLAAVSLLLFVYQIHHEEHLLVKKYNKKYLQYRKSSWALVPYIY